MKYFFILGRNPKLSRFELYSYLDARLVKYKEILFEENILIIKLDNDFLFNIEEFGGILKLGKLTYEGNRKEFINYLESNEIIFHFKF